MFGPWIWKPEECTVGRFTRKTPCAISGGILTRGLHYLRRTSNLENTPSPPPPPSAFFFLKFMVHLYRNEPGPQFFRSLESFSFLFLQLWLWQQVLCLWQQVTLIRDKSFLKLWLVTLQTPAITYNILCCSVHLFVVKLSQGCQQCSRSWIIIPCQDVGLNKRYQSSSPPTL